MSPFNDDKSISKKDGEVILPDEVKKSKNDEKTGNLESQPLVKAENSPAPLPAVTPDKSRPPKDESKFKDSGRRRDAYHSDKRDRPRTQADSRFSDRSSRPVAKIRISIIIPAFNEEDNIRPLLEQFNDVISRAGNDWEVVLVDDGSTDKTLERAREAGNRFRWLRIISYSHNRGLTAALSTGFKNARGSIFVFYPADMQYHANDIPKMIARIDKGADVVTGWKQGKYKKRFVSYIYNRFCRMLFGIKIHDMNSVKAFKKEVVDSIPMRRDWHRYLVVLAADAGFVIDEVRVTLFPRHSGRSKFGTSRIVGGVLDLLSVKFQLSFTKKPLRLFGSWGLVFLFIGLLFGLDALYMRFFTEHGSRALLYPVILFTISGLLLFAVGFLAEVIVSLREEIESLKSK